MDRSLRIGRSLLAARAVLGAVLIVLTLAACGGGSGNLPVEVAGDWQGTWFSNTAGAGSTLTATFTRTNGTVEGTVNIVGSTCLTTGTLTGEVTSNEVTFGAISGEHDIQFQGERSGSKIEGTYAVMGGGCQGDTGTFSIMKVD